MDNKSRDTHSCNTVLDAVKQTTSTGSLLLMYAVNVQALEKDVASAVDDCTSSNG